MGKQKKSSNPERKRKIRKEQSVELLKKPFGMPNSIFKEMAWILAIELKQRKKQKE